jgi:hypothetical protein
MRLSPILPILQADDKPMQRKTAAEIPLKTQDNFDSNQMAIVTNVGSIH